MKKKLNFGIIALLMLCLFTACSSDDNENKSIEVPSGQQLNQTVFADDTQGKSQVSFTTVGAWTSSIAVSSVKTTASGKPDWVSISPDSGDKAGTYNITISLAPNYSGEERSATITINCNGHSIEIKITQEATDKDGEKPVEETNYNLGFILLKGNNGDEATQPGSQYTKPVRSYELIITDEMGNTKNTITSFSDTCYFSLLNYNETTKDVYIQKYSSVLTSTDIQTVSEILAVNIETKATKKLAQNLPDYDQLYISADGKYVVYDKVYKLEKQQIIKQYLADKKEIILSESMNWGGGASIRSINKDGSIVILTEDNKIMVMEGSVEKYSFTEGTGDYIEAYLSPDEALLVIQYGESGLKICNLDGNNKEIIKTDDGNSESYIESLLWSADSKYIYIDNYRKENTVYKVDVEKKSNQLLTDKFSVPFLYNASLSIKIPK